MKKKLYPYHSLLQFSLIGFFVFVAIVGCQKETLDEFSSESPKVIDEDVINIRSSESILTAGVVNDEFGISVATVGNKVYVGNRNVQKVYEYTKTGGSYALTNEITPNVAAPLFGIALSVSGNWMAVGAPVSNSSTNGKVFMYQRKGNAWIQKAVLTGPATNLNFGGLRCVALQGNTLAVTSLIPGSPAVSTMSIFTRSGNAWSLQQEIVVAGIRHNAVKLDVSETHIATAGVLNNNSFFPRALIFVTDGSTWTLEDEVVINISGVSGGFDVAIDGNTIVLPAHISPGNRNFVITNDGGNWEVSQEILTPATQANANKFVDIEGNKIIIGASTTNNAFPDQVHVFENFGATWELTGTLTPSDLGVNVRIMSVALESNTILAGCPGASGFPGKVYAFE